jgi:hypothetical protein
MTLTGIYHLRKPVDEKSLAIPDRSVTHVGKLYCHLFKEVQKNCCHCPGHYFKPVLGHAMTNRVFAQQVGQTQAGQILGKDHVPHVGQDHIIVDPDHIVVFEPGHSPIHLPPVHIEP